jgi:hypothetical protein
LCAGCEAAVRHGVLEKLKLGRLVPGIAKSFITLNEPSDMQQISTQTEE